MIPKKLKIYDNLFLFRVTLRKYSIVNIDTVINSTILRIPTILSDRLFKVSKEYKFNY